MTTWTLQLTTWEECFLCWDAKGYKLDSITLEIQTLGLPGLGRTTISTLSRTSERAPPEVAELVWKLPVRPEASRTRYEIYRRGLEAAARTETNAEPVKVAPVGPEAPAALPAIDLEALATAVVSRLPKLDTLESKLDALTATTGGKLDTLQATANDTDAKAELEAIKRERDKQEIIRVVRSTGVLVVLAAVVLVHCQPPAAAPPAPGVTVTVRTGAAEAAASASTGQEDPYGALVKGIGMGRKTWRPMPHKALPHQGTKPCQGSATTLYDACWIETSKHAPCPLDQYQEGEKCYIPLAADPTVPVTEAPRVPGQE